MPAVLKNKGLQTLKNNLSEVDSGALVVGRNVNLNKDSIIEPRRGFKGYGDTTTSPELKVKQLITYKGTLIRHFSDKLQYDVGSGSFTSFDGSYSETEAGLRMKAIEANSNLYLTTSDGVKKISATSSSEFTPSTGYIELAGISKAQDLEGVINASPSGFMLNDTAVAYRLLWGKRDTNNNLILGSPSPRVVIQNTSGGQANTTITATIPPDITTDHFYQLYRTATVTPATAEPGDEMNLVDEGTVTSGDITAGFFSVDDITPEDFRVGGTLLYTNPVSGAGILQANDRPPLCKDISLFKNSVFYSNTNTLHRREIGLLSVDGFTSNVSSLIIGNSTAYREYVFRNTGDGGEDTATQKVLLSGAISPAQAVDETARSLVKVINRDTSGIVYAYYLSGPEDVPGLILFESRSIVDEPFYFAVNESAISTKWSIDLPVDATPSTPFTSTVSSDNEDSPNRIYFSKFQQPEAVPIVNYIDLGPRDKHIRRIIGLRDSLFALKDDGVYRITGSSATTGFSASLFDSTSIVAPDSAVVLNNQIYALSDDGVITISETGVGIISRDIEDIITDVTNSNFPNFSTASFGVAYDSDKSYLLWLVKNTSDTVATQALRFNSFTNTWTLWDKTNTCGIVNPENDMLYLGAGDVNFVEEERKSFSNRDYADREFSSSIISNGAYDNSVVVSSTVEYEIGDVLSQTQYLTISQFNRLLKKLDLDPGVDDSDYYSTLGTIPGVNLTNALQLLAIKLDADTGITDTDYQSSIGGGATFTDQQDDFNIIVGKLNADTGVTYTNYTTSSGTITFDSIVREIIGNESTVVLSFYLPLIAGDTTILKAIKTEVQWVPQHFGDPSVLKQVSEGTLIFRSNSFTSATISYSSDLNPGFVDIAFENPGLGTWGMFNWGEQNWGGEGNQVPIRTLIPLQAQRCRFLNVKFKHSNALEYFAIQGISLMPRLLSTRSYK